jgi:hypothetical protein
MVRARFVRAVAALGAVFWLVVGFWAFFAPRSFVEEVGTFPPYNEHFVHDAGAFALGLGVVLVLALLEFPSLSVALTGSALAAGLHEVAHFLDEDLGGKDADRITLGLLAVLLVAAAAASWPQRRGRL